MSGTLFFSPGQGVSDVINPPKTTEDNEDEAQEGDERFIRSHNSVGKNRPSVLVPAVLRVRFNETELITFPSTSR